MRYFRTAILVCAATSALSAANIDLSGASTFGTDNTGAWSGGITATPRPDGLCCQLSVLEVNTFNNGASPVAMPFYTLTPGAHTLYLETSNWSSVGGFYGVNLYFDGVYTAPGISAFTTATGDQTDLSQPFFADSATTGGMFNESLPGAGTLIYSSGGSTVTLTGLQWVPGGGSNPYNAALTVVRVDLNVSGAAAAPEPVSFTLFGAGLVAVGLIRRRRASAR